VKPMIYFYIPVFNEQETVGVLLYRLREVMQTQRHKYTVLLTLDGCRDETPEIIAQYIKLMPIRVVDRTKRYGYGKSLWEAIRRVNRESENPKRDFLLILDADFTQDPGLLGEMFGQIERNIDFCYGNRFGSKKSGLSLRKKVANLIVSRLLPLRGIRLKAKSDLFNTLRGCRVQSLRRKYKQLQILNRCGPGIPPSGVGLLLLLLLSKDARRSYEVKYSEKLIRRRTSRFRIIPLLRLVLFGELPDTGARHKEVEPVPRHRRRGRRRWKSNKKQPDSSKVKAVQKPEN